jgi:hypothetical protein
MFWNFVDSKAIYYRGRMSTDHGTPYGKTDILSPQNPVPQPGTHDTHFGHIPDEPASRTN